MGEFYFTQIEDVLRLLRTVDGRVKLGNPNEDEFAISKEEVSDFVREAEGYILSYLGRFFDNPISALERDTPEARLSRIILGRISSREAAYQIALSLYDSGSLPQKAVAWKKEADEFLKSISRVTLPGQKKLIETTGPRVITRRSSFSQYSGYDGVSRQLSEDGDEEYHEE
ncbi:hypothetical protein J7K18_03485 [bacterium]|nr:hypothetical protein [bacterium]